AIVSYGWLSAGREWVGELALYLEPALGEAYVWNCFTLEAHRRRGHYRRVLEGIVSVARSEGLRRLWIGSVDVPAEKADSDAGLGRAAALALARQGARIVAADFDSPRMQHTVDEILRLGTADSAIGLETDVRDDSSVRALARSALKAFGRADFVVNAAGVLLQ